MYSRCIKFETVEVLKKELKAVISWKRQENESRATI